MGWRTSWLLCCCALSLMAAGCQRLHHEKSFTVGPGESKFFELPAASGEQKVDVQITATAPVHVFVLTEAEFAKAEKSQAFDRSKALASKEGATNETLQATGPAGQKIGVVVEGFTKKSEVKLVIDGR